MFGSGVLMEAGARQASPTALPARGPSLGCVGLGLGLVVWFMMANAPSSGRLTWEWSAARLHEAVLFGSIAAVAVGLGVRSARRERPRWVGLAAIVGGCVLVGRCVAELARRL